MLGLIIFVVLLSGPRAKWVHKLLPNTVNRVVLTVPVLALVVGWFAYGILHIARGNRGEGFFNLAISALVGAVLYRFVSEWWLSKAAQSPSP